MVFDCVECKSLRCACVAAWSKIVVPVWLVSGPLGNIVTRNDKGTPTRLP